MKFLLFVAIVVGLWLAIRGMPSKEEQVASLHSDGFLEVRATMEFGSTELEMVIVEEKPLLSDCKNPQLMKKFVAACPDDMRCELTRSECKAKVDQRYLNMLNKRPTHLHYAHMEQANESMRRSGVMVVWGMTMDESMTLCRSLIRDPELQKLPDSSWTCI